MPVIRSVQAGPVTSAGGAEGLPFRSGGLFTPSAGALQAFRAAAAARVASTTDAGLGLVITPKTSIRDAIATVCGTKAGASGRRILLSEGTWDFPTGGLTIDRDDVEIIALSPNNTFFKQNSRASTPMLTITGAHVRLQGITFGTFSSSAPAVEVQGTNVLIDDCRFLIGIGVLATGTTSGLCVRNCEWMGTANAAAISISGTCLDPQIVGNRFRQISGVVNISANTVLRAVVVGNSFSPTGMIYAPFGYGHVIDDNSAAWNATSYSLADNTTAANVSSTYARWPVANVFGVSLDFSLTRGATPDVLTGRLDIAINSADCIVYMDAVTTTVSPGVTFDGNVSAGYAYLRYTTTPTGSGATLRLGPPKERTY